MRRNHSLILPIVMLVSGCGALSGYDYRYPPDWHARTDAPKHCASFQGEYVNKGVAWYASQSGSPYLAIRFGLQFESIEALEEVDSIRIACKSDNVLLVEAIATGSVVQSLEIERSAGTWDIEGSRMLFPTLNLSDAEALGGVLKYVSFSLSISTVGALIGEQKSHSGALAFWVIPMAGSQTFWFSWAQL